MLFNASLKKTLNYINYFITGSLFLYGTALIIRYAILPFISDRSFNEVFFPSIVLYTAISIVINLIQVIKDGLYIHFKEWRFIAACFLVSLTVFTLFNYRNPYVLNWDMFEHQTLVNQILRGNFELITSKISDTFVFNGYTSIFHLLMSVSQYLFPGISLLTFWRNITFFHLFLTVIASYVIAYVITGKRGAGLISALIGAFVYESTVAYTSLAFVPQNLTAVAVVFLISQVVSNIHNKEKLSKMVILLFLVFLILNHFVVGSLGIALFILTYLLERNIERMSFRAIKWAFAILIVTIIASVWLFSGINLNWLNKGEAAFYNFNLLQKFSYMRGAYGYLLLLFFPLGFVAALKTRNKNIIIAVFLAVLLGGLSLLPLPYVLKTYTVARFFVHVVLALGVYALFSKLPLLLQILSYGCLAITLTVIFLTNIAIWKDVSSYKNEFTHISDEEIQTAEFLKRNYDSQNTLIISDPSTQYILEALSGIDTQGGAYMDIKSRIVLGNLKDNDNFQENHYYLSQINDSIHDNTKKRLFIPSGRYFRWLELEAEKRNSFTSNIWIPTKLTLEDWNAINRYKGSDYFQKVYENQELSVFEVK
jgi:hypothetical protein